MYRRRPYSAETMEQACIIAPGDEGWDGAREAVDDSGETYVSGVWQGKTVYDSPELAIPDAFREAVERKAELIDDLVALLREPAQPMGISEHDFRNWLPRAMAILAKAEAIHAGDAAST
ncbi:hypothetical protein G6M78_16015 [Agrobacterium tumefaciens]|uniref:hypothetical protein n=1 Tax=Agrobacterium tumefaciens TaxID=358 RepID=UPI0015736D34|nr:hypothetical protein [Agrobacterium tumefaciens]MCZ7497242.1 hypothetical protein [Rhizobium rhizogenes]NTE56583.1 hypothetical protein [Agrobacterium tumefaciens]NTE74552.1 hypothetical protein [Agrobacterium tumefaciens]